MFNRFFVAVFIFGLAPGLSALAHISEPQQNETNQNVKIEIPFPPYQEFKEPDSDYGLERPCKDGEDNRDSDLCAQWKAADAAKQSADWTKYTFWLGFSGTIINFLTFAAAAAAAVYARRAAIATNIANDILLGEQRPWLSLGLNAAMDLKLRENRIGFGMAISIKNIGKRPALDVHCDMHCFNSFSFDDEPKIAKLRDDLITKVIENKIRTDIVLPGEIIFINKASSIELDRPNNLMEYKMYSPTIIAIAIYRINGDTEWRCNATLFDIYQKSDDGTGLGTHIDLSKSEIAKEGINIIRRRNAVSN